jgi:hypothetical protein
MIERLTSEKYDFVWLEKENKWACINKATSAYYKIDIDNRICTCPDFKYTDKVDERECKHIKLLDTLLKEKLKEMEKDRKELEEDQKKELEELSKPVTPVQPVQPVEITKPHTEKPIIETIQRVEDKQPYELMERKDEEQILAEMRQGGVIDEYFYSFSQKGRQVTGISYAGIMALAQQRGDFQLGEMSISDFGDCYIAKVKAKDNQTGVEAWGVASQPKSMHISEMYARKIGSKTKSIPDEFAITKVASKATRNAYRRLLPEKIVIKLMEDWKKKTQGKSARPQ